MDDKETAAHIERMKVADEVTFAKTVIAKYLKGLPFYIDKLGTESQRLGELDQQLRGAG